MCTRNTDNIFSISQDSIALGTARSQSKALANHAQGMKFSALEFLAGFIWIPSTCPLAFRGFLLLSSLGFKSFSPLVWTTIKETGLVPPCRGLSVLIFLLHAHMSACVWYAWDKKIYYEVLAHTAVLAEKSHDLRSASWRPGEVSDVVWRSDNQRAGMYSSPGLQGWAPGTVKAPEDWCPSSAVWQRTKSAFSHPFVPYRHT